MKAEKEQLDTIKLSSLERMIRQIKKEIAPRKDCDLSFEFIIASCFPKIMDNIKDAFTQNYIAGYNAAKEQFCNDN